MEYQDFLAFLRQSAEENTSGVGLLRIPELRRRLFPELPRDVFDAWLVRSRNEDVVHLLTHVDPHSLGASEQDDCLCEAQGLLLYWVRWVGSGTES